MQNNPVDWFLPPRGLQGANVPIQITWRDDDFAGLTLTFDCPVEVVEVHNAAYPNETTGIIDLEEIQRNGYIGLVFEAPFWDSPLRDLAVSMDLELEGQGRYNAEKTIQLTRPDLVVESGERLHHDVLGEWESKLLINKGPSTAVIEVTHREDSDLKITSPYSAEDFRRAFAEDLEDHLSRLAHLYPDKEGLIHNLPRNLFPMQSFSDKERLNEVDEYLRDLSIEIAKDEDFANDLMEIIELSLFNNIELITVVEQFFEFIKSIKNGNIILTNPLDVVHIEDGRNNLLLTLEYTDLNRNDYSPIDLDFPFISKGSHKIPIYELFEVKDVS